MTNYGLRARVITLTLAPTLIIGLILSSFFSFNRYRDLETQVITTGTSIAEPLAIASEPHLLSESREAVRHLISYAHRKNSKLIRSIAVFDAHNELFVTSNFHPNFETLMYPKNKPIPNVSHSELRENTLILRVPIISENDYNGPNSAANQAIGYLAIEVDLSSLRLQQYQEIFSAFLVLILGIGLAAMFAFRLMNEVTKPISHMRNVVDRIRRGHLDSRIDENMHGELDELKKGINAMAISLSEYHIEMQNSIDQATSDLRETLEQLEIQNVELDIAKKRAQEAARVKSEFLANMSHELRTPLNGVIGFTRQILKTQLTNSQTDYLQTIEKSAKNLLNIINDILDFSKLEAGKLALENIPFEFRESLEEVVALQAASAHEKGLELTLKLDGKIPPALVGDPLRIQQILTNLVGNSIKFTQHGNIDISVELKGQQQNNIELQFMVKDTGIGISERQQSQLFQAFSQADASISRRYGGTGLGLVITQKLVSQMGGEISLTSRLHQGSTFWFTLHLHVSDMPMSDPLNTEALQGQQVLLIDGNIQSASITQTLLNEEGMQVSYQDALPTRCDPVDHLLLCLSPNQTYLPGAVEEMIEKAQQLCSEVILVTPTTSLAMADKIIAQYPVKSLTKPLGKKKLLQALSAPQKPIHANRLPAEIPMSTETLPLTVLAVDDNPANLKLISALLKERVDHVVTARDGAEAVTIAEQQTFDLIFMDIQMPNMDGVTACQTIKQGRQNAHTPVIAVTAHALAGERDRLLKKGMDDYLTKPIEEHVLEQVLQHWNPQFDQTAISPIHLPEGSQLGHFTTLDKHSIDWPQALKQAANKDDLARDMLMMLVDSFADIEQAVEASLAGQLEAMHLLQYIHKLHGSCAYSGVPRLKSLSKTIEETLKQGKLIQDVEPELFELLDEIDKVRLEAPNYTQQTHHGHHS
ncbi:MULTISPECIES: two-component sensor histidine kinase BarA [unclassified Vibrio]|uniref:histidine kinase n=1 Tax=Vibrio sp. HB236076 TaxID=3232307 RepID=A0AB39HF02_9VIBR|nr:two-component sensor histidine kinase BarA [Vibrio sp. HB161653]MDP5253959.1 two-component sensor histidine kinase BarA [Vibrio sp. HB161653]